jgi:hypothetical protein
MTKRHFEAIARILKERSEATRGNDFDGFVQVDAIADALADFFAAENPRFDRLRFLIACGTQDPYTP